MCSLRMTSMCLSFTHGPRLYVTKTTTVTKNTNTPCKCLCVLRAWCSSCAAAVGQCSKLVGHVRNQRELARTLDRGLQLALMQRAGVGDAAWLDLAALGQERRQQADVLVVDVVDLLRAELADAPAAEEPSARALARLGLVVLALRSAAAAAAATTFFAHRCPPSYLSPRS